MAPAKAWSTLGKMLVPRKACVVPGRMGNEHAGRSGAVQPGLSCQVKGCPGQVVGPCEQQQDSVLQLCKLQRHQGSAGEVEVGKWRLHVVIIE